MTPTNFELLLWFIGVVSTIIGFFLLQFYLQVKKLISDVADMKTKQAVTDEKIIHVLQLIQNKINE